MGNHSVLSKQIKSQNIKFGINKIMLKLNPKRSQLVVPQLPLIYYS